MVTNYYNSSNDFASPIRREPKPYTEPDRIQICEKDKPKHKPKNDDFSLILGLIALLLITGCRDKLLLIALLYLFLD